MASQHERGLGGWIDREREVYRYIYKEREKERKIYIYINEDGNKYMQR